MSRRRRRRRAALGQAEERPRAFAKALDQPGFGQQPQMARQPRLRLAQDFGEVGDGQLGLGEQHQDAQRVASPAALSVAVEPGEAQLLLIHRAISRHFFHIKISLYH